MRRIIGIAILVIASLTNIALLASGHLGSEGSVSTAAGGTAFVSWHVTEVDFHPNWWVAVPLALCFLAGLLCALLPQRR